MADSNFGERMTTRSTVDEKTVFTPDISEVHVQGEACGGQSADLSDGGGDYLETEEQHVTASKQKVGVPTFESLEFDDIDELNIDDTNETTRNKSTQTCIPKWKPREGVNTPTGG